MSDSSGLEASTYGQGNAGSITISARNSVSLDGTNGDFASAIFSRVEEGATGQGGNIRINTGSVSLTNGGQISASTFGEGSSGSVIIEARDVILDGVSSDGRFSSAVFSTVGDPGRGQAGNIQITTTSLSLTNGAKFDTTTFGEGNAGNIIIDARDTVSFNGADAFSVVQEDAIGRGGDIRITTGSLAVTKGGQLQTLIRGQGNADQWCWTKF